MSSSPHVFAVASAPAQSGSAPSQRTKAQLLVYPPPKKGSTLLEGQPQTIAFWFNPKELAVTRTAKWKREAQPKKPKSGTPTFTGADPIKFTVEMFLDATDKMDSSVVDQIELLFKCCVPTPESVKDEAPSTPFVVFQWGSLSAFTSVVTSVSAKYTLFTPAGIPVRAVATVAMEEMPAEVKGQNPTSGALAARDLHPVVAGDTLESVAYRSYGDPALWREIAHANDIDDPMRLRPGTVLLLPAIEEMDSRGQ